MKNYVKPVVLSNDELAEGVYAASGAGENCYTVTTNIHQKPETGRGDYRIQVDGKHNAINHHSTAQTLILYFNQNVEYVSSNGTCVGGSGTTQLSISYGYHNNQVDNIGLGDVVVTSDAGLAVTGAQLTCNYTCDQHDSLGNY